jgi:hypothetical protein
MKRVSNLWYEAIYVQLRSAGGPLGVDQIWRGMVESGFKHSSKSPRSTLGARIAELVQMEKLERVGPATYQLLRWEIFS